MKVHISFSGVRAGTTDLDKKMPDISKIYPEGFKEELLEMFNKNMCTKEKAIEKLKTKL